MSEQPKIIINPASSVGGLRVCIFIDEIDGKPLSAAEVFGVDVYISEEQFINSDSKRFGEDYGMPLLDCLRQQYAAKRAAALAI